LCKAGSEVYLEYLTVYSRFRVSIRGFTKQTDADGAKFSLLRRDNQKKVLDESATQVTKTSSLNPVIWEIAVDADLIKAALGDDEMQCGVSVSLTAGGKTWSPSEQNYVIYRNTITISAKDKDSAAILGARCTCTIHKPVDYQPPNPAGIAGNLNRGPNSVLTGPDGTAELLLDAPGVLDLQWDYPYYPDDNAAWTALTSVKRETVLLQRERKAHFIRPDLTKGDEQKHYVNLPPKPGSNRGRKLAIVVASERGLAGDTLYLSVELTSADTTDPSGNPIQCELEGQEVEVGKAKTTLSLKLDDDGGNRVAELDFKGYGGITAKLTVSTVEGSSDQEVTVTSWRRVDVQPYHPAPGFFAGNMFPSTLAQKVTECFDEVFIEVRFLQSRELVSSFPEVEERGKFEIVRLSAEHAQEAGLGGSSNSSTERVYFKMGSSAGDSPLDWINRFTGTLKTQPQRALHVIFAHGSLTPRSLPTSLILTDEQSVSEPQTSTLVLATRNLDPQDSDRSIVFPWRAGEPSYWQVAGDEKRNEVTSEFIEIDRDKARQGQYEYRVRLPHPVHPNPTPAVLGGREIKVNVNLRAYEFGGSSANLAPLLYIVMDSGSDSARTAYSVIHELAHTLGFAPEKGEFFYEVSGRHCANGIKSDAEKYVGDNQGTVGATVAETLAKGLPGRNIPLELAAAGKFGTCVMWGHTDRQKTTEALFTAALKFCSSCAPLIRITPIGSIVGGEI
jgi:hypothetical protein